MATFSTDTFTNQGLGVTSLNSTPNNGLNVSGTVHNAHISYTLSGNEATGDTLNIVRLPAGAIPLVADSYVLAQDPGTTLTAKVGVASDDDALAPTMTLSAGGRVEFTSASVGAYGITPTALASTDTAIVATLASVSTLTAGNKIVFYISYKLP